MDEAGKTIYMRLPSDVVEKFERLTEEFQGLPRNMVLRFLLNHLLEKPLREQVSAVQEQIRGSDGKASD
jgi:hypothetical protein